jgi:hypothetical protein
MGAARTGDTIEQAMCRQRTEEEQQAVDMCLMLTDLFGAGAVEIRRSYGQDKKSSDLE